MPKTAEPKPGKPDSDFPLFPHAAGVWVKKIRGKLHYFGPWSNSDAALRKHLDQRDDLQAGRTPRVQGDGLTIRELCNRFLTAKQHLVDTGELARKTFRDYYDSCEHIIKAFRRTRLVMDLGTVDFEKLPLKPGHHPWSRGARKPDSPRPDRIQVRLRCRTP